MIKIDHINVSYFKKTMRLRDYKPNHLSWNKLTGAEEENHNFTSSLDKKKTLIIITYIGNYIQTSVLLFLEVLYWKNQIGVLIKKIVIKLPKLMIKIKNGSNEIQ